MGSEEMREKLGMDFSPSQSEEHNEGDLGEQEEEVEREEERGVEEGKEEREDSDSVPAAEDLSIVKPVIGEASTSMQGTSGSAAGLDEESPILPQTIPIQSEVTVTLIDQTSALNFYL